MGVVFSALPSVGELVLSGYSQRLDKATGKVGDDYLYSLRVSREEWARIDFENLQLVDPVEALGALDIRRKMTKTGVFKPVTPFGQ